jgi:hypothetical protein
VVASILLLAGATIGLILRTWPKKVRAAARRRSESSRLTRFYASYIDSDGYIAVCRVIGTTMAVLFTLVFLLLLLARRKFPNC